MDEKVCDTNDKTEGQGLCPSMPYVLVLSPEQALDMEIYMHRCWLDATEHAIAVRGGGRVTWDGPFPELQMSTESRNAQPYH